MFVIPDFEKTRDSNVCKSFLLGEPMRKSPDWIISTIVPALNCVTVIAALLQQKGKGRYGGRRILIFWRVGRFSQFQRKSFGKRLMQLLGRLTLCRSPRAFHWYGQGGSSVVFLSQNYQAAQGDWMKSKNTCILLTVQISLRKYRPNSPQSSL